MYDFNKHVLGMSENKLIIGPTRLNVKLLLNNLKNRCDIGVFLFPELNIG